MTTEKAGPVADDCFDGIGWREYMRGIENGNIDPTGVRLRAVCRLARENLEALENAEPVAWQDIAATLCGVDGNGFYPMDCTPTMEEAYKIRAQAVAALYAAPPRCDAQSVRDATIEECARRRKPYKTASFRTSHPYR